MGSISSYNLLYFIEYILSIICNLLYLIFDLFLCGNLIVGLIGVFFSTVRSGGFLGGLCWCSGIVWVSACCLVQLIELIAIHSQYTHMAQPPPKISKPTQFYPPTQAPPLQPN